MEVTFFLNRIYVYASLYASDGRVKMSIKETCDTTLDKAPKDVKNTMNAITLAVDEYISNCKLGRKPVLKKGVEAVISSCLLGVSPKGGLTLSDALQKYIEGLTSGKVLRDGKKAGAATVKNLEYAKKMIDRDTNLGGVSIEAFSAIHFNKLVSTLFKLKYAQNTVFIYANAVLFFFKYTYKSWHNNPIHKEDDIFQGKESIDHAIYYTVPEIMAIYKTKLEGKREVCRDAFVYGCFTGMRISDHNKHSDKNITDKAIILNTTKTSTGVTIPLHPVVKDILAKYGGHPPHVNEATLNQYIKLICRDVNGEDGKPLFHDAVVFKRIEGGERVERLTTRWSLTSTHTMRRSCATNMFLSGMDIVIIMRLMGWRNMDTAKRYFKASNLDVATRAAEMPFYNPKAS